MNEDIIKGEGQQVTAEAQKLGGKLTDDDLVQAQGNAEKLAATGRER